MEITDRDRAFIAAGNKYRDQLLYQGSIGCVIGKSVPPDDLLVKQALDHWRSNVRVTMDISVRWPVYGWEIVGWMPREYGYNIRHYESSPITMLRRLTAKQLLEASVVVRFDAKCVKPITLALPPAPTPIIWDADIPLSVPALKTKTFEFLPVSSVMEITPREYLKYEKRPEWFDRWRDEFLQQAWAMTRAKLNSYE